MTTMINPKSAASASSRSAERLFRQPVPPSLVHRVDETDVFVTDLRVTGYDMFEVSGRLPGSHSFYGPRRHGLHDPLAVLETIREAILVVGHVAYDIPREFKFITHDKQFEFDLEALVATDDQPVDLTIALTSLDIKRRGRRVASMRTHVECFRDGKLVGTASYRWSCVSAAAYKKLRGEYATAEPAAPADLVPVAPELVGRTDEVDVTLAERSDGPGYEMRVDPKHPVIYDHVMDHVPGNAIAEVARQVAMLVTGDPDALTVGGDFLFSHYIEFDTPCLVNAEVIGSTIGGTTGVRFVIEQNDRHAVDGILELVLS